MILQNLVFPKETICNEEKLYIHTQAGSLRTEEDRYVLSPGCEVDFFTYFNSFSACAASRMSIQTEPSLR